jgi:DNA-binding transcriptional ArsR family regulator
VLESIGISGERTDGDDEAGAGGAVHEMGSAGDTTVDHQQSEETEQADAETEPERPEPSLPLDQVFEILKNRRRREVLHYLNDHDGTATLSDLAEHIAALENDTTVAAISSSQRKRVYVGLYQCHLPKMDDMNIVDFEQNRGTIELASNAGQLDQYLEDRSAGRDWAPIYLGLAALAGGLLVAAYLGAAQFGLTPTVVLVGLIVGTGCCAGFEFYQNAAEDEE